MLLQAEHLSINFGSRQLLTDVNFYLNEGDKVGIIGINGTGKSTFLKVLAGAIEADEGRIVRSPNAQISYLSQNPIMEDEATISLSRWFVGSSRISTSAGCTRAETSATRLR